MAYRIRCPNCGNKHTWKSSYNITRRGRRVRRQCPDCGRTFYTGQIIPFKSVAATGLVAQREEKEKNVENPDN